MARFSPGRFHPSFGSLRRNRMPLFESICFSSFGARVIVGDGKFIHLCAAIDEALAGGQAQMTACLRVHRPCHSQLRTHFSTNCLHISIIIIGTYTAFSLYTFELHY